MACRSVTWPPLMASSINKISTTTTTLCGRQLPSTSRHHNFATNCFNPPQDSLLKAIAEVSKREGRVGEATIVVFGGSDSSSSASSLGLLHRKLYSYPRKRGFTAIGTGGDDFVQAMVYAVESVVQRPIPQGQVRQKISSRGKYVSVKIGPVQVASSEQVEAVYYAMRSDERMKYFL